jgi:glycine dehydrogenase
MEIANASLLDEGTAAAEAMTMALTSASKREPRPFGSLKDVIPRPLPWLKPAPYPWGLRLWWDHPPVDFDAHVFGALLQYPATDGTIL